MMIPTDPRSSISKLSSLEMKIRDDWNHIVIFDGKDKSDGILRTCELESKFLEELLEKIKNAYLLQVGFVRNYVTPPIFGIGKSNDIYKLEFYIADGIKNYPIKPSIIAYDVGLLGEIIQYYEIPSIYLPGSFLKKRTDSICETLWVEYDYNSLFELSKSLNGKEEML